MILRSVSLLVATVLGPGVLLAQGTRFGASVAAADVNGDGFADVVVGEPDFGATYPEEGRVLVYLGSAAGPASTPSWTRSGHQSRAHLGEHVAGVGDLNADGFDDVAMTAPEWDVGWRRASKDEASPARLADAGLLVVYLGSPNGLRAMPALF